MWTKPWKQNKQYDKAYSNNQEQNRKEIKRHELSGFNALFVFINV
jgi:hypothetical protein